MTGLAWAANSALPLQLEVLLNGRPANFIAAFLLFPDGRLAAAPSELEGLGLKVPASASQPDTLLLDDIGGLKYTYSIQTLTIDITVSDAGRLTKAFDASAANAAPDPVQIGTGFVVNYDLFGSGSNHSKDYALAFDGVSASLDARVFGPYGTFSSSGIARDFEGVDVPFLRLNTTWSFSDPGRLLTYRAGDFVSGGLPWTRPVRLGGVQVQRNFELRPDLITRPLPSFAGSAVVPSTVDVYVNNAKAYSQDVPEGPFEINNIPTVSGSGTARIVVRDASGRETETASPFFASSQLLRQGLYDFSAETGVARRDFGIQSISYADELLASATARFGLTNELTIEGHAEAAASSLINAGLGFTTQVRTWGRFSAAGSFSSHDGETGAQVYAALELQMLGFNLFASTRRSIGPFADLGSVTVERKNAFASFGSPLANFYNVSPPKAIDQISLGLPLPFDDTRLSLTFLHLESDSSATSYDIASASYTRPLFGGLSLYSTVFKTFGESDGLGAYFGVTMPLGDYGSVSSSVVKDRYGIGYGADYSKPLASEPGSYGWQVSVQEGPSQLHQAALAYRGSQAEVRGRATHRQDGISGTAEISGAVVGANGGVFLTNRIDDAFAVVDAGVANVDVLYENHRVATTGANGKALVTGLRSYQTARIAIDPSNLPVDAVIPSTEARVTPADRSGVAVNFNVRDSVPAALLVLRRPDGTFLPAGSHARIEGHHGEFVIGYDGQAFVEDLAATNTVVVTLVGGECRAVFDYHPTTGTQTVIDPVVCQ